jgi:hypothetical protein
LLNGSNQVVRRTLNAAAFTGGGLTTASLPLTVSGSDVRLANPSLISDIGTPASTDRFLIYDTSLTTWKRIDYSALSALINPLAYQSAPELVARTRADLTLTASAQYLEFANVGANPTDSTEVGAAADVYNFASAYGGTNDGIRVNFDGVYEITLSAAFTTGGTNIDITLNFDLNGATVSTSQTSFKNAGAHFITQSTISNLATGDTISVTSLASATSTLEQYSILHIRKL